MLGCRGLNGCGEGKLVGSVQVISEEFESERTKCNWHVALYDLQGLGMRRSQSIQFGSASARNSDDGCVERSK